MSTRIQKFIWDLTYACPLRCLHCYSESGRRAASMLSREDANRVVDVILSAQPERISISGGEPLLVPWWDEVAERLHDRGVAVTLFTSGWVMDERIASRLADVVTDVAVSIDGRDPSVNDVVRGRRGAFAKAVAALELLCAVKRERRADGRPHYVIGVDYTLTRTGTADGDLERFVEDITTRFPEVDFIRFGAVIPSGLAAEQDFVDNELLSYQELVDLAASHDRLAAHVRSEAQVTITDVRYFLPDADESVSAVDIASIEADGGLRAFPIYEAKVGNVLEEPLDVLWSRVHAWRTDPFVVKQMQSINTVEDWARVTQTFDRRFGSEADKRRIARRRPRDLGRSSRAS